MYKVIIGLIPGVIHKIFEGKVFKPHSLNPKGSPRRKKGKGHINKVDVKGGCGQSTPLREFESNFQGRELAKPQWRLHDPVSQ